MHMSMDLKLESGDDFLLATFTGQVSLSEAIKFCKAVCDTAGERGFQKIIVDCSGLVGALSLGERYELGRTMAEYCLRKSAAFKVATVGKPPTVDGFGSRVAWNRGLVADIFLDQQEAMKWLSAFGSESKSNESRI
jgi:hypothetical protein